MTQPISREDCQRGGVKSGQVRQAKRDAKVAQLDPLTAYQRGYQAGYQAGIHPPKKARAVLSETVCAECGRKTFEAGLCFYCRQAAKFKEFDA